MLTRQRRISLTLTLTALTATLVAPGPASAAPARAANAPSAAAPTRAAPPAAFPDTFALPNGFQPEGIAIGPGGFAYFGSRADGSIYRVNLATGQGRVISPALPPGHPSVGLKIDNRARLFVAGRRC
ncbi:MAG TPA: hypothetical protein VF755_29370, partial [Catenuloplanes sp.]